MGCALSLRGLICDSCQPVRGNTAIGNSISRRTNVIYLGTSISFLFDNIYSEYTRSMGGRVGFSISGVLMERLTGSTSTSSSRCVILRSNILSLSSCVERRIRLFLPDGVLYGPSYGNLYDGYNGGLGLNSYSYGGTISPEVTTLLRLLSRSGGSSIRWEELWG